MKRRDFIKNGLKLGVAVNALPLALGGFPIKALGRSPLRSALTASAANDNILVIIQLSGGNDGLNTLVPHTDAKYYTNRPTLGLKKTENNLIELVGHESLAWNSTMTGANTLFTQGKMAVMQNVGYPNMDLSHFRGTDIWNNATDRNRFTNTGWVGRFLSEMYPDYPPDVIPKGSQPLAIQFGNSLSNAFLGKNGGMGIAINKLPDTGNESVHNYDPIPGPPTTIPYQELQYVRLIEKETEVYSQSLVDRSVKTNKVTYPTSNIATQLSYVSQIIASGFSTKVYLVTQSGYDTHSGQLQDQASLLGDLSAAMLAFQNDLEASGLADRVVTMTYSEFGRRPTENGTGTDHGAAAPLFVFGTNVKGKVYGNDPDLTNLVSGNLAYDPRHDFRNIYSTMMSEWLGISDEDIQGVLTASNGETYSTNTDWLKLGIIKSTQSDVDYSSSTPGLMLMQNYPNPVASTTTIEFALPEPGYVQIGIFDMKGNEVERIADGRFGEGVNKAKFSPGNLANGVYLYRLRTEKSDVTRHLVIAK
jgi:uncharacterized protein (DUF1501 family)